ncbi:unnamed protein product [Brachionus calyciflorus]|uniref:Reverse transcriptase domain-containing protein n=1 Tax=Brachionus calyciflorus TaxID=104777 RepID=A0A813XDB1_9BILA|nr:unnamed protein product [Brachionus calyciflorus]
MWTAFFLLKETALINKRQKKRTYVCTIDASKAFDKINRNNLWGKMIRIFEPFIVRAFINYYSVSIVFIIVNGSKTGMIKTSRDVKQGGPLSPLLFSIYIDELGNRLDKGVSRVKIGNIKINKKLYADDLLLITNNIDEMNRLLNITEEYGREFEI